MSTPQKKNNASAQGSTVVSPGVANVDVPTDFEVSTHAHGAGRTPDAAAVLAAGEAQDGVRLHDAASAQLDAGLAQGPLYGDHRELPVEVDRFVEAKAALQEERDASEPRRVV